ncbi:hypothetical protein ACMD2_14449 [Ananas comosus]|uniref:Uncharacterized protein n=1 Tax=Ananas comosus TaxID=4615 RepID=A0A199V5L6_ANACO|nr:hypothetical protein ACMD2_14449 [Ananas comosus]
MSATCTCPQLFGQPVQCILTVRGTETSFSTSSVTFNARALVSIMACPQNWLPVHATRLFIRREGYGENFSKSGSLRSASTCVSFTLGIIMFCSTVRRSSPELYWSARRASSNMSEACRRPTAEVSVGLEDRFAHGNDVLSGHPRIEGHSLSTSLGAKESAHQKIEAEFSILHRRHLPVMNAESRLVYGRVSTISWGSMPARGLPTGLRTLSIPLCKLVSPTAARPSMMAGTSGSCTPRICQFCRVVTSAHPSLLYPSTTLARYRVCSLVVTPFGSFSRIMNRPSACNPTTRSSSAHKP